MCRKGITLYNMCDISLGGLMRNRLTLDGSDFCTKLSCSICVISSSCACIAAVFSAYISSSLSAMRLFDFVDVNKLARKTFKSTPFARLQHCNDR